MRVDVDHDLCCGNGMCVAIAPGYFKLLDDGTLVVQKHDVAPEDFDTLEEAVINCPVEAIRLTDQAGDSR